MPPTPIATSSPAAFLTNSPITFTVTIPAADTTASAKRRLPKYISSAIASVVFRLTAVVPTNDAIYGGALNTDTLVAVTLGSPNCVQAANGDNTCTATATAPAPAVDTFTVYTFGIVNPVVGTTVPLSIYVGYALGVSATGTNTATVATNGYGLLTGFAPTGPGDLVTGRGLRQIVRN